MTTSVLVVGVEPILSQFLTTQGFSVTSTNVTSTENLCKLLSSKKYDALLLGPETRFHSVSVDLIRRDGYRGAILRIERGPRTGDWSRRCAIFLDAGGDDVILAPTYAEEIACLVEIATRKADVVADDVITFSNGASSLVINNRRKMVLVDECVVDFTAAEFTLLRTLATTKGPIEPKTLLEKMKTDVSARSYSNVVMVMTCRVRKKIGNAVKILTRYGVGYELVVNIE